MVNNPIGKEWRNHYITLFRVVDFLNAIFARLIRFIPQHLPKRIKIFKDILIETLNVGMVGFALLCGILG